MPPQQVLSVIRQRKVSPAVQQHSILQTPMNQKNFEALVSKFFTVEPVQANEGCESEAGITSEGEESGSCGGEAGPEPCLPEQPPKATPGRLEGKIYSQETTTQFSLQQKNSLVATVENLLHQLKVLEEKAKIDTQRKEEQIMSLEK